MDPFSWLIFIGHLNYILDILTHFKIVGGQTLGPVRPKYTFVSGNAGDQKISPGRPQNIFFFNFPGDTLLHLYN